MHRILIAILATAAFATAAAQTLTVWVWDINKPALESTIASFQEMHPGVDVVVEDIGNQNAYDRGLAGCAAGGFDLPDVYLVENGEAQVFWATFPDCFVDLRTLGAEELRGSFPEFKWTELMAGDAMYAIPYDSGPTAMFYRTDLYEQAGIDVAAIETWDDYIAAGQAMNAATDGAVKMGTVAKGADDEWFRMLANQAGCFYFDNDATAVTVAQPGCVQALDTLKKLYDADVLAVGGWSEQIQLFQNSSVASAFFGSWYGGVIQAEAPDQAGLWGVYLTPALEPGGVRASNLGGSALAVPASGRQRRTRVRLRRQRARRRRQPDRHPARLRPHPVAPDPARRPVPRRGRPLLRRSAGLGRDPRHARRRPGGRRQRLLPRGARGHDRRRQRLPRRQLRLRAGRARPRRAADRPGHRPADRPVNDRRRASHLGSPSAPLPRVARRRATRSRTESGAPPTAAPRRAEGAPA